MAHPSHDEHPHVPGPSLWPVGFAVGVVVLLVGLIVSWYIAALGAILALVFGFLWVRDLTAGTRARPRRTRWRPRGARRAVATSRSCRPRTPADRYPRSKFLEISTLGLGAVIGGLVTAARARLHGRAGVPEAGRQGPRPRAADDYPEGKFIVTTYMTNPAQGAVSRRTAFMRNNGQLNGLPSFTIISNHCAHLGCPVQPNGPLDERQTKQYKAT